MQKGYAKLYKTDCIRIHERCSQETGQLFLNTVAFVFTTTKYPLKQIECLTEVNEGILRKREIVLCKVKWQKTHVQTLLPDLMVFVFQLFSHTVYSFPGLGNWNKILGKK